HTTRTPISPRKRRTERLAELAPRKIWQNFLSRVNQASSSAERRNTMETRDTRCWFATFLVIMLFLSVGAHAGQKDFQKLTVGYTPIGGAAIPFFIAVEEKIFQKYGFEVAPVFMGGSPMINSAILAGEFPIGYTGGGAIISSRLAGSDLIAIASPLPVLTIDGWSKPVIKSVSDLRGKRIGVTRFGASSYFAGLSMLESAG